MKDRSHLHLPYKITCNMHSQRRYAGKRPADGATYIRSGRTGRTRYTVVHAHLHFASHSEATMGLG